MLHINHLKHWFSAKNSLFRLFLGQNYSRLERIGFVKASLHVIAIICCFDIYNSKTNFIDIYLLQKLAGFHKTNKCQLCRTQDFFLT